MHVYSRHLGGNTRAEHKGRGQYNSYCGLDKYVSFPFLDQNQESVLKQVLYFCGRIVQCYYTATTYNQWVMFDWYWNVVEEMTSVVVGTEEAVEVGAPSALNWRMVVVHVKHFAAVGGWGSFLLAVAVAWALEVQAENRTVGHTFLVEFVAGL